MVVQSRASISKGCVGARFTCQGVGAAVVGLRQRVVPVAFWNQLEMSSAELILTGEEAVGLAHLGPRPAGTAALGGNRLATGISPRSEEHVLELAKRSMVPRTEEIEVREAGRRHSLSVSRLGVGPLDTCFGDFLEYKFYISDEWGDYTVILKGGTDDDFNPRFRNPHRLYLRVDSGCQTGQLFGDRTCECRDQLLRAMELIDRAGEGLIICIPGQDGRGKGLPFKLATLTLQTELGYDTVQAAEALANGGPLDERTFGGAVAILKFLGCGRGVHFALLTNNPKKMDVFSENGFSFGRAAIAVPPTEHTQRHLEAKQRKLDHLDLLAPRVGASMSST